MIITPKSILEDTIVLPMNSLEESERLLRAQSDSIAAIVIDPVPTNLGMIEMEPSYLSMIQDLAQDIGALIIVDEVIAFRLAYNGAQSADDAAVIRLDEKTALVQTVDFFTPIVDDPFIFGEIAAANSLSDIYAMGATPLFALNIVGFPKDDLPLTVLGEILNGGSVKAQEAGISILGGHSIDDKEPKYGLVVTGKISLDKIVTNGGAKPGDYLILTKPLGSGIISTAIKRGEATKSLIKAGSKLMTTLNSSAGKLMVKHGATAATDVTGFGLLGHLWEMCQARAVSVEINSDGLTIINETEQQILLSS